MTTAQAGCLLERDVHGVRVLSLNRPHRHNAIDDALHDQLVTAFARAAADPAVRVVLLRGEGPSFCSGRDVGELGRRVDGESDFLFVRRHQGFRLAQLDCPKPVVAALHGAVLGGGLEMALAADVRLAADDVALAFPEIRYGLMTDTGGSVLAMALAGPSRAKLMLMTGRRIDARLALAWGLVDEVVPGQDLERAALALCAELAERSPQALATIKQVVDEAWHGTVHAAMRAELLAQVALFGSEDYLGLRAARSGTPR